MKRCKTCAHFELRDDEHNEDMWGFCKGGLAGNPPSVFAYIKAPCGGARVIVEVNELHGCPRHVERK